MMLLAASFGAAVGAQLTCEVAWGGWMLRWAVTSGCAVLIASWTAAQTVRADTLNGALINAYQNNPQLNSQRAVVRQTDEAVPQALSG